MTKLYIILFCFLYIMSATGQTNKSSNESKSLNSNSDSLELKNVISDVIKNHPSIKEAEEVINEADAKINLAKSGYYPNIDVEGSYTRLGPMSGINFPGLGSFQLYPLNNYNAALDFNENIYDFGKTARNVNYENENKNLSKETLEQVKEKLALTTAITFYSYVYLQQAIDIKDEQLKNLNEHLEYIKKKEETGLATQYEMLSTKVRISNVESQKIDLQTALKVQLTALNTLLGIAENTPHSIKKDISVLNSQFSNLNSDDSIISYAFSHRPELMIANEKTKLLELKYKIVQNQNNPNLNVFATGGWKNGFFPDLNVLTANFAAGIGIKVPLFDAMRKKNNLVLAKSSITNSNYETDLTKRNITNEVVENKANMSAALKKIEQYSLQYKQAQEAHSLAVTSFKAGAITNLDLLDATTSVSESRLSLLKSKIDYILSTFKFRMAIGENLY